MTETATIPFCAPSAFWDDHRDRCNSLTAIEVKRTKKGVHVLLDAACIKDLHSDANYYLECMEGWEWQWLVSSARATLHRLTKAGLITGGE